MVYNIDIIGLLSDYDRHLHIKSTRKRKMIYTDNEYITKIRREHHMYPEVDYDLPKTAALIT